MKLYAISDIHISHSANLEAFARLRPHPDDWLLLGGDIGETEEDLHTCLRITTERFARVFWVPGNHELWRVPEHSPGGVARYERLLAVCREFGVTTPEDEYTLWPGPGPRCLIAPLFLLYDYSFRCAGMPERLNAAEAIEWSREKGIVCADESLLETAPYAGRVEWCHARVAATERRLATVPPETPLIILNHFPLRNEFAYLPRIPSFTIWCGTRKTENWHTRFPVHTAVSGHIHWRRDERRDGVRFVECSLGYPRDWLGSGRPVDDYLVEILPGPG